MHIPLWTTLFHAARHNGVSLESQVDSADICLPFELQTAVPGCALDCLQTFISNNYVDLICSTTADLGYLCRTTTFSGLTIGEGSLQCVISSCLDVDIETQSGYTICDGIVGARPNMAGTITATVSAITTLLSTTEDSMAPASSTPVISSTSDILSTVATTEVSTSATDLPTPVPTFSVFTSTSSFPMSITDSEPATVTSTETSQMTTSTSTSSSVPSSSQTTTPSSAISTESRSAVSSSSTATASSTTAATATEGAQKTVLNTGAKAGIITVSVVIAALIIGYLAYVCIVRRKDSQKRRSRNFSMLISPTEKYDGAGSAPLAVAENTQNSSVSNSNRRFYSGEAAQENRQSSGPRNFANSPDIGVAMAPSTRVSPERHANLPPTRSSRMSLLSPVSPLQPTQFVQSYPTQQTNRWGPTTTMDEDLEAQNQDVPILGSPRARALAKSFSVKSVERPAPLRFSKVRPRGDSPPTARIPLTPVYDNGTFEPTIKQVFEPPIVPPSAVQRPNDVQSVNFSRKPPSLTRASRDHEGPFWSQNRRPSDQHPARSVIAARKQSEASNMSVSVYTEFEDDETPENDENKQLKMPVPPMRAAGRLPLRDLQWPQVPRPASVSKQATKPHSPRAALTIRRVDPIRDAPPPQPKFTTRKELADSATSIAVTYNTSTHFQSPDSGSPVFPMPPARTYKRTPNKRETDIESQISDAYTAASLPTTARNSKRYSTRFPELYPHNSNAAPPGAMYQQIQRLSTGRPLAQKLQFRNRAPPTIPTRSSSRAKVTPMTSRRGDMYLTIAELEA